MRILALSMPKYVTSKEENVIFAPDLDESIILAVSVGLRRTLSEKVRALRFLLSLAARRSAAGVLLCTPAAPFR